MERRYVSALLSALVFPGAGQFYNGQRVKGIIYILLTVSSITALAFFVMRGVYRALEDTYSNGGAPWSALGWELSGSGGAITVLIVVLVLSWVAGIVDAYLVAKNRQDQIIRRFIPRKGR